MYVLFGTKFSKLFCGPMWSVNSTDQSSALVDSTRGKNPLEVNWTSIAVCLCDANKLCLLGSWECTSVG